MTGPEVMRAFRVWAEVAHRQALRQEQPWEPIHDAYPLWIPQASRWYVRERVPGTRVWLAEEDGSFTLLSNPPTSLEAR